MERLAQNKTKECWNELMKIGFRCNDSKTLLHFLVAAQNPEALYVLIYHGADCTVTNKRQKTCIDLLASQLSQGSTKEGAKACLLAIKNACYKRRTEKPEAIKPEEDLKLREIEDKIHLMMK